MAGSEQIGRPTAFLNARLVDPDSGYDGPGALLVENGLIAEVARGIDPETVSDDFAVVDCGGAMLAPGLVDLRVKTGEPGAEPKETLKSAVRAAAAGGVTTIVLQPDTDPTIDEPAMVDFIMRRARDLEMVHVHVAGAATRGCEGARISEIGLMCEAGAVYFTDADRPIVDSKVFGRVLTYAKSFGAAVAHRPADPWLTAGAVATSGELAGRLGLPSAAAVAERIMLERDLLMAELTGGRLIVDQITTTGSLESLQQAKARGVQATATASINHLSFNELDIGDYRTFYRLDPPLRSEADRQALLDAVGAGLVEVVVSAHAPAPAEDKRLPFSEAAPGAIGLQTLLPALIALHLDDGPPLIDLIRAATLGPARLIGLDTGRLARGAPADLVLCDVEAPIVVDAEALLSKSKNSPFDRRRLQGQVRLTMVGGRRVFEA